MGRVIKVIEDEKRVGGRLTARVKKKGKQKFSEVITLKEGKNVKKNRKKDKRVSE
ncbi:MAG: hypothetical protein ACTSPI_00670 [Candidatus Heimdallarchaeaceae archaeon]